jgi:multidrug efflux pump subunit AcrA (membrane-fusion protein)
MRVAVAVVVLGAAAWSAACSHAPQPVADQGPARLVPVARAAVESFPDVFEAGGIVQSRTTATITSRIAAPVLSVHVAAGDRVRAGQVLVRLDGRDLEAQRQRATAAAEALMRAAAAARAEREGADAALVLARATHARIVSLHEHRAATPHELDEAVSTLHGAEARLTAVEAQVAGSEASIESARAATTAATVTASYAVITAPFDGVVTEKLAEPGNLATPGIALLRLEDANAARLEVRIDASRATLLAPGQTVEVLVDREASAAPVRGRVAEVARAVEAGSQSFTVKIDLPTSTVMRSGTFARARFGGRTHQALTVPSAAIVRHGQLPTVFVVHDKRARMRVVSIGDEANGRVEILAGVVAGELVIAPLPPALRDGELVEPDGRVASNGGR